MSTFWTIVITVFVCDFLHLAVLLLARENPKFRELLKKVTIYI